MALAPTCVTQISPPIRIKCVSKWLYDIGQETGTEGRKAQVRASLIMCDIGNFSLLNSAQVNLQVLYSVPRPAKLTRERLMKYPVITLVILMPVLMGGCASAPGEKVPLDSDPRIGEKVSQVCFTRNIHSWDNVDNDRNAVILKMTNREAYKLKLSVGCDPDWAMSHIAVIPRGGANCYSAGDRIITDATRSQSYGSACTITRINKWDPEALTSPE